MSHSRRVLYAVSLIVVVALCAPLGATEPVQKAPAEEQTLESMLRRDAAALPQRTTADGAVTVDLQGGFRSVMIATTVDGKRIVTCIDSLAAARKLLGPRRPDKAAGDADRTQAQKANKKTPQRLIEAMQNQMAGH